MEPILCDICHEPVDLAEVHWFHDEDCPNRNWGVDGDEDAEYVTCQCDNAVCPDCCPVCVRTANEGG